MNESVDSDAFVIPSSSGRPCAGRPPADHALVLFEETELVDCSSTRNQERVRVPLDEHLTLLDRQSFPVPILFVIYNKGAGATYVDTPVPYAKPKN